MTAATAQLSLLDQFVPPAPGDKLFDELVAIAIRLERRPDITGVTVGEVVFEYEKTTKKQVGGIPMLIVTGIGPFLYQCVASWSMWEPGEI